MLYYIYDTMCIIYNLREINSVASKQKKLQGQSARHFRGMWIRLFLSWLCKMGHFVGWCAKHL